MQRNLNNTTHQSGRSIREVSLVAREARRLVGFEREQARSGFGRSYRTGMRISHCPSGAERTKAVIRRAVLVPAA